MKLTLNEVVSVRFTLSISTQVLLPFPKYVYGKMVLKGEVLDDHDRPIADQTSTEMLVIELLDNFQVIDKKVRQLPGHRQEGATEGNGGQLDTNDLGWWPGLCLMPTA